MVARGPLRHTVVISDVHLGEAEPPGDDRWLRYRQRQFFPDDEFVQFVELMLSSLSDDDAFELVFDGDLLEFEGPKVIDGVSRFDDAPRSEEEAVEMLQRVARDHTRFFGAVARIASIGHRIVFVAGNHDAQLSFPRVQSALLGSIAAQLPPGDEALARVSIHPWFYQTDDGVHVEHGHQYDAYCSFRDPLRPLDVAGMEIQPTVGSLAFRHLVSRMGYFNAYDDRSFMLSVPRYLLHWVRYYLFTRRSLAYTWLRGALKIMLELVRSRPARSLRATLREQAVIQRAAYAQTLAMDAKALAAHAGLFSEPADASPHRVVRELRLDHTALAAVGLAGLITAAFKPKLGLAMALGALAVGIAQEVIAPRESFSAGAGYRHVDNVARSIAKIYRARAVVFGHTHVPNAQIEDGAIYANAGSWAPTAEDAEMTRPSTKGRPVVWLRRPKDDPDAPMSGGLYRYRNGALVPHTVTIGDAEDAASELGEPTFATS